MTHGTDIGTHPDIVRMRERYELAGASPRAQVADGLTMLAGLYLAISPWIIGFNGLPGITVNNLVTGLAVALLGLGFSFAFGRTHGITWVLPLIGLWTIAAPWAIRGPMATTATIWNNVVIGAILLALGLATAGMGMARRS
ncbi:hypothetical protein Misp01_46450 [Microtetraspora sp. NBRC 13810]|uniref:SPW repeat protein n=1 Tax=Microtetraspora sp. NBRC 13810 TaxID=3030990 RepID=UPI0024A210A6|nr:SPW repeat protein [Microtetraspora sp. NBRC 13810]GLW09516.1 hypothetical protein Misp01_46450 [Microtetraspora sp. NBRC 13810]